MERAEQSILFFLAGVAVGLAGCAKSKPGNQFEPPQPAVLNKLGPETIIPLTTFRLSGFNFLETAEHTLLLYGALKQSSGSKEVELRIPIQNLISPEQAEAPTDQSVFTVLGEGSFSGNAEVISRNSAGEVRSDSLPVQFKVKQHLAPQLNALGSGVVFLNSRVEVTGEGLLLGDAEGQTFAEVKGCFLRADASGTCKESGRSVSAKVKVKAEKDISRNHGTFEFSPSIAGLSPGSFEGTVTLSNVHSDGHTAGSEERSTTFRLERTRIERFDHTSVSLGRYFDIRGAGFVGGEQGSTVLQFDGSFTPTGGSPKPVRFDLVATYQDGSWIRGVGEEGQGMGSVANLRKERGTFTGIWTPVVFWNNQQEVGQSLSHALTIAPVRQAVWVRFSKGWNESMRRYGLNAADNLIRQRILAVMARDYIGINIEFHDTEPVDFKYYTKVDLTGQDPNGLGLLGYDNTPGKDVDNKRLYDWVGGVNAMSQEDGYPGYGGVFLESLLGFSLHPPADIQKAPIASKSFDDIFDHFRPDQENGRPLTTAEVLQIDELESTEGCPASSRLMQAACAVHILGNIIGSTSSHELGHSFGLANPYGSSTDYHNHGDLPNRLMEGGGDRPFEERAQLEGQGPAVFCQEEFDYLKKLLRLEPSNDPPVSRPPCD